MPRSFTSVTLTCSGLLVMGLAFAPPASGTVNLLTNSGFETLEPISGAPATTGDWGVDPSSIVTTQNGVVARTGVRMLKFDQTDIAGGNGAGADVAQLVDVSTMSSEVDAGHVSLCASAWFNRIAGDAQTDTQFRIYIRSFTGSPSDFPLGPIPTAEHIGSLISDGDVNTWQIASAQLSLPAGTRYVAILLSAVENVFNDAPPAIQLDGHYADDVVAIASVSTGPTNVLTNGGFEHNEAIGGNPSSTGDWDVDVSSIAVSEKGVVPRGGIRMLKFETTGVTGVENGAGADVAQLVDVSALRSEIDAGHVSMCASAWFNRVAGDAQTDTQFQVLLRAFDGAPAGFPTDSIPIASSVGSLISDSNTATWEFAGTQLNLSAGTAYVAAYLQAVENVFNDAPPAVQLDGHYADDAAVCLTGLNGTIVGVESDGGWVPRGTSSITILRNPSPGTAQIQLRVGYQARVNVAVYDAQGRRVRTLHDGSLAPGTYKLPWDGADQSGHRVGSGIYFARLEVANRPPEMRKLVYVR